MQEALVLIWTILLNAGKSATLSLFFQHLFFEGEKVQGYLFPVFSILKK